MDNYLISIISFIAGIIYIRIMDYLWRSVSEPKSESYIQRYLRKRRLRKILNKLDDWQWDDYDENGIPYWEKTGFVDPDEYNRRDGEIIPDIQKDIE